jgi:hypothetical protein
MYDRDGKEINSIAPRERICRHHLQALVANAAINYRDDDIGVVLASPS